MNQVPIGQVLKLFEFASKPEQSGLPGLIYLEIIYIQTQVLYSTIINENRCDCKKRVTVFDFSFGYLLKKDRKLQIGSEKAPRNSFSKPQEVFRFSKWKNGQYQPSKVRLQVCPDNYAQGVISLTPLRGSSKRHVNFLVTLSKQKV